MAQTDHLRTFASGDAPVSVTVVEAIAEERDTDPLEIEPLWNSVDPEALDRLFTAANGDADLSVSFTVDDCLVTVQDDGSITTRTDPGGSTSTPQGASSE
jgi:hypothetical protein